MQLPLYLHPFGHAAAWYASFVLCAIVACDAVSSAERIARYKKFKDFEARIMVATDLFGRGIDIERGA
jgi:hypothetical protein